MIYLLFFYTSLGILYAQSKGTLNYKLTIKTRIEQNELNRIIYFKDGQSIELGIPKKQLNKTEKFRNQKLMKPEC